MDEIPEAFGSIELWLNSNSIDPHEGIIKTDLQQNFALNDMTISEYLQHVVGTLCRYLPSELVLDARLGRGLPWCHPCGSLETSTHTIH